ncbi:MAG TPA: hypothetical protein VHP36_07660 [Chitinispirillaceae bacterium]|nr:hypothetical protein [Chitinispirillaceae bacterium]
MRISVSTKKTIQQKSVSYSRKISAMDALVVNYPDLSSKLKFQNLLNYFMECLNQLTSGSSQRTVYKERFICCVKFLESEFRNISDHLDEQITTNLQELLVDSNQYLNLLEAFSDPQSDHPVDIILSAKSSHLQWLAVCLLEDLKIPFSF